MKGVNSYNTEAVLLVSIVNVGIGSRVLKTAKKFGVSGGTIFRGKGTVNNSILHLLSLADSRKEIVLMGATREVGYQAAEKMAEELKFNKPNHGIAFLMPLKKICGSRGCVCMEPVKGDIEDIMFDMIYTIVDRGKGEDVIEAAQKAGSQGGTIINARGTGLHEREHVFNMDIEPEKEIVMILSPENMTDAITDSIRRMMRIDEPGQGVIFVQSVEKTYGIYQK